ncbi:hypothetical protein Kpol_1001p8 [Vanderwaltozyma polyspora DSM 70294]|uniref:Uncharacterized protein n=1 Tax=Vanderwaltozyma polyspora (strain ATCC 22028 / DSM 70294 / BCRC 21397 / CBS 2163 / NBRC 10782 / NRRL Y-8283 / UCD 57-17) TaxID=436907 RepID=A7TNP5_VANPO|nr:uncharacterized protein Kpol_1001p8 [Vanderwaltozyma polyspora DSM 70294]EDO16096.1 hypothetical protein Kpol_1001p8 [Vanderwaltozyma polyspora DSM 70294]
MSSGNIVSEEINSVVADGVVVVESGDNKGLFDLGAKWQDEEYKERVQKPVLAEDVLVRINDITEIMKSDSEETVNSSGRNNDEGDLDDRMDWDQLYEVSANIMDEYTKEVDIILSNLNKLSKSQYLWQEAAFVLDSHHGAMVFNRSKDWVNAKERHLDFKRKELDQSADVIKKTIERLTKGQ